MTRELYHHGILGQKWGKRNGPPYPLSDSQRSKKERTLNADLNEQTHLKAKTKDGQLISIDQEAHDKFQRLIAKGFKAANKNMMNTKIMGLSIDGKKIGDVELFQESKDSVNIVWLGVNKNQRGKGYATSVLSEVLNECKRRGYKQCTLEVPGDSPDARHIYEKLGFKETGMVTSADEDFVWGGLTAMKIDLRK